MTVRSNSLFAGPASVSGVSVLAYTVPAGVRTIVKQVITQNIDVTTITGIVSRIAADHVTFVCGIVTDLNLAQNGLRYYPMTLVLLPGEQIVIEQFNSANAGAYRVQISGSELVLP